MPMPKTAMHKDDSYKANEGNVGLSWNIFVVQTVSASANLAT